MSGIRFGRVATLGLLALAVCTSTALGAAAQQFPRVQEENLVGQQVVLPDAAASKVAVLVFGFSKASQIPTEAWAKRILSDFGKAPSFQLYQLAVLQSVPRMFRGMIISGIRKGVPESQRANFLPVLHNEDELKTLVGFKEPDDAYLLLLDRSGKIAYQMHGAASDQSYEQLRARVESLLK